MESRTCAGCGQEKPIDDFNYRVKARGLRQRYWRVCTRLQLRAHYEQNSPVYLRKARSRNDQVKRRNQENLLAYLARHPCVDCGEADVVCLQFDHVRGQKVKSV